jgi:hypothetical protein
VEWSPSDVGHGLDFSSDWPCFCDLLPVRHFSFLWWESRLLRGKEKLRNRGSEEGGQRSEGRGSQAQVGRIKGGVRWKEKGKDSVWE